MIKNNNIKGQMTIMKELGIKPNFAQLSKEMGVDWRTAKKYYEGYDPKKLTRNKTSKLDVFQEEIREKLKINRTTINGVYNFFIKKYGIDSIGGYSNFITYVRVKHLLPKKSKSKGHPRYETPIGMQIQVDWKEDISMENRAGDIFTINIFNMELCYSRYHYLELSIYKRQADVFRCLINGFKYFGGMTSELLFDNMSTVADTTGSSKKVNTKMASFSNDIGFKVKLCGTRQAQTKGKVESRNKMLDWLRPYKKEFDTLEELYVIIEEINHKINTDICQATNLPPNVLFYKEKEYLTPLPHASIIEKYLLLTKVKVSSDSLIRYNGIKYSVNPKLIGEHVEIDVLDNKLYVYYKQNLETVHSLNEKPVNYKEDHYKLLMKNKVKEADFYERVSKNLSMFDNILKKRNVEITKEKAIKSIEAFAAYISKPRENNINNWIRQEYAIMKKEDRQLFYEQMRCILPQISDENLMFQYLKFAVKNSSLHDLEFNLLMTVLENDVHEIFSSTGLNILMQKYKQEIYNEYENIVSQMENDIEPTIEDDFLLS